jgi:hypothetical protein
MKLPSGFIWQGKKVKECEIKRRPTVADRVKAVLFSKSKFGEEVEDAVACYLISELCEFEGKKIPAEFLLENMDYEDMVVVWEQVVKFRPPSQVSEEGGSGSSESRMELQRGEEPEREGSS